MWSLINRHRLVWNAAFEKYTDPRCQNIKVTLSPDFIPAFIPAIPSLFTYQVRACIPVFSADGEKLDFEAAEGEAKKKEDIEKRGDPVQIEDMYSHDIEEALKELDVDATTGNTLAQHKKLELQREKDQIESNQNRLKRHQTLLLTARSKSQKKTEKFDVVSNPPPWFPEAEEGDDTYVIKRLTEYIDHFATRNIEAAWSGWMPRRSLPCRNG